MSDRDRDLDIQLDIEEKKRQFRAFRRLWIPAIKVIITSSADIFGDWLFYNRTRAFDDEDNVLGDLESYLYFFCCVSSFLGILSLTTIILEKCSCCINNHSAVKASFLVKTRWLMGLEMFVEDIPQVVLTVMVMYAKNGGEWSSVAAFNATTSAFNFTFNLLDMFMPLEEEHIEKLKGDNDLAEKMLPKKGEVA